MVVNAMHAFVVVESGLRRGLAAFATLRWWEAVRREGERERGWHRCVPLDPTKLIWWLTSMEMVVSVENGGGKLSNNSTMGSAHAMAEATMVGERWRRG